MRTAALGQSLASRLARRLVPSHAVSTVLGLFAGTMFLSALLLFSVQPMFAKMVLPKLGGAPSVWAVSMCFFQAVLLAGYCYAHVLNRYAPRHLAPLVHLALMGLAVVVLPIGLSAGWSEAPAGDAYLWLIGALAAGVGLPFFAVSANAPLLQSWFARSGHPHASDPYFLYGASNLGSLLALLAYPFLVEPFARLGTQAALWAAGFVALGIAIAMCGLVLVADARNPAAAEAPATGTAGAPAATVPTRADRIGWVWLAAVPSGLLVAFTSYVTTDIASAPFLWVLPLAAFLLTFILVFKERPAIRHDWLLLAQPLLVAGVLYGLATMGNTGWMIASLCGTGAFFVSTMVAHRELYERRPAPEHLTEFYLLMSLGGVLGGMFAALLAPKLFATIWEFPLLVVLGMTCRPGVFKRLPDDEIRDLFRLAAASLIVMAAVGIAMRSGYLPPLTLPRTFFILAFGAATLFAVGQPLKQLAFSLVMGAAVVLLPSAMNQGNAERSFFGVHRVSQVGNDQMRILMHGTTIHGAERIAAASDKPQELGRPATYYYPGGPMARGVDAARVASGKLERGLSVGVVGLGAGSMACYSRSGEAWRFYEIDPVVAAIAQDRKKFTFLSRCRPGADIVLGDARLTLGREPAAAFDYLLIDAFSSDSVPVHLLTVEALQLYLAKLSANGILALHVSNRHLDLVSVVAATVAAVPGLKAIVADDRISEKGLDTAASHVVFISRSDAAMQPLRVFPYMKAMPAADTTAWTDDFSNILTAMWRNYRNGQ